MSLEVEQHGVLINGVAANAAEANRTATVYVEHASDVAFTVSLSHTAATALNATCYGSADEGATYKQVHSVAISSGTGTMSEYTQTEAVTGDDDMLVNLACAPYTHVKIIVSATGGGANDLLTVKASSAVWS